MTVVVRFTGGGKWKRQAKLPPTRDTRALLHAFVPMWEGLPTTGVIFLVGVVLTELSNDASTPIPMFTPERQSVLLSEVMDRVNQRYGYDAVYPASMHGAKRSAPMRISFSTVPDLDFPDRHEE